MGRDKLKKPKKPRKVRPMTLADSLGAFERDETWSLLVAAGASPLVRERWSSVGFLVDAFVKSSASGPTLGATTPTISGLLAAVDATVLDHARYEDYLPADPRLNVRVRLDAETVRLFPGCVERPVADVDRALLVAGVIDDLLVSNLGFGIADVLRVALGYSNFAIGLFSPHWPQTDHLEENDNDGGFLLTEAELSAARRLVEVGTPEHLLADERAQLALEWLTCNASDLNFEPGHPQSPFGRFLRFRTSLEEEPRWLPLAFIPEVLSYAVGDLAKSVAYSGSARFRFAQTSAAAARDYLWRFTDEITGAPERRDGPMVSENNVVQWLIPAGDRLVIAVQVLSALDIDGAAFDGEFAAHTAAKEAAEGREVSIRLPYGGVTLPAGCEVLPLVVVSSADHVMTVQEKGIVSMSLDDLRWLSTSADNELDLLNFCRDLLRPGAVRTMGFETIDYWESWRANGKALFAGGRAPSMMLIQAHWGEAEWDRAGAWTPVEVALAILKLPALRETVGLVHSESPAQVYRWLTTMTETDADGLPTDLSGVNVRPSPEGWCVYAGQIPVAVAATDESWSTREQRQLLGDLSGSLAFAIEGIRSVWSDAHSLSDVSGYVLGLSSADTGPDNRSLWVSNVNVGHDGIVHATVNTHFDRFLEIGDGDSDAIRAEIATAMAELVELTGLDSSACERVDVAVRASAPTMTLHISQTTTMRNHLRSPLRLDPAFISAVDRLVAERVREAGVAPGLYEGDAAKNLDRGVLAGVAFDILQERIGAYDTDDLITFGMEQLQRAAEQSRRVVENIKRSAEVLTLAWDPQVKLAETQAEGLLLRRCNEIVIEAALRSTPAGGRVIDDAAWGGILAAANSYFASTMRSESVHYQVTPTGILIDDLFQISTPPTKNVDVDPDGRPVYQLDVSAYSDSLVSEGFTEEWEETEPPPGLQETVEREMRNAFGASDSDIYTALLGLASLPYAAGDREVATMSVGDAITMVLERTVLGEEADGAERAAAAMSMLSSTSEGIKADDWKPWHARTRRRRLLVQPVPVLSTGDVLIAPHYLLSSLGVYRNYLGQGLLPWSQPAPPAKLEQALQSFRGAKNLALEADIVDLLTRRGWVVVGNVKPAKASRLGLRALTTEIDAVAGRADDPVIRLIEAKDPAGVFATPQVRRQLDDFFFSDGKHRAYAAQLQRKFDELAPFAASVAEALGLPPRDPSTPYRIEPMFVTRRPVPAAFVPGSFPFLTVATLLKSLGTEHSQ